MADIIPYMCIPYKDGGRDRTGVDCLGLVILVLREVYGKELMDVDYESAEIANTHLIDPYQATIHAVEVDEPIDGDLVLLHPTHIGIYMTGGYVLHTSAKLGTVCERLNSPRIRGRLKGFYRV